METKRLPLDAMLAGRDATGSTDGILKNLYKEATSIGNMVVKRGGLSVSTANVGTGQSGTTGQLITSYHNGIGGATFLAIVIGDTLFIQ